MPVVSESMYPTIENVLTLTRVHLNDTKNSGAGVIFTDSASFTLPTLNQAIQRYVRMLEQAGIPTTKRDIVATLNGAVTPITPPNQAAGTPDPTVQVYIGFAGYFNGSTMSQWPQLPADCLYVRRVWERPTGTSLDFSELSEVPALASFQQGQVLGNWCWRQDAIWMNGSIVSQDLRIEYMSAGFAQYYSSTTPVESFPTTYIPFLDAAEPLSYACAAIFSESRTQPGAANYWWEQVQKTVAETKNRYIRRQQRVGNYSRAPYGDSGDFFDMY